MQPKRGVQRVQQQVQQPEAVRETAKQALATPDPLLYVEGEVPRGVRIDEVELQTILDTFLDCRKRGMMLMDAYERTGRTVGRDTKVIAGVISRLRPTTDAARMYIKSRSLKLTKRLVRKAGPTEILDILSRPGIDVLSPPAKNTNTEGGGFFISVNAESCGAVKVGVLNAADPKSLPPLAEDVPFDPFTDRQGGFADENGNAPHGNDAPEAKARTQEVLSVLDRARQRLQSARLASRGADGNAQHQEVGGLQGRDECPEAE